jgi:PQQ system protein
MWPLAALSIDRRPLRSFALAAALPLAISACEYGRMLRPSVLSELSPPVARLVNELPELDANNKATVAELYALGGLAHLEPGADGVMRTHITVPQHHMLWTPAVLVAPRGGPIELQFSNYDQSFHIAYLPSNGGRQVLELPAGHGGRAQITLDQPGLYWFGCPVGDHVGRGMLGLIIVRGEAPAEARLDRPAQVRPSR